MNAVGVLDRGFVTAVEPVMEQKLSLGVPLLTMLSLLTFCVCLGRKGITIVVA